MKVKISQWIVKVIRIKMEFLNNSNSKEARRVWRGEFTHKWLLRTTSKDFASM
jgi:hypothetical protein